MSIQQTEHLTRKQEKKGEKKKGQKTEISDFFDNQKTDNGLQEGKCFCFVF